MASTQKNHLSLIESILSLCFLSLFFIFFLFSFFFLFFSQCLFPCCDSLLEVTITVIIPPTVHDKGPLYNVCRDQLLLFQPLTTFVWSGCHYQPPLVRQSLNHHHLPVLAVPFLITRQKRLFCLFVCRGTFTYYGVSVFSLYPSWHTPSGSSSSLLLLSGMSSQQDISTKRA